MNAHVFLNNKIEDGSLQEIEILGVDSVKMDEFYLSIYGTLLPDEEHEIIGNLIGLFISGDVVGYYLEDM